MVPLVLAALLSFTAQARDPRQICLDAELESLGQEDPTPRLTYRRDIQSKTDAKLSELPLEVKQHVIIVAKDAYLQGYEPRDGWNGRWSTIGELSTTTEAVEYIRQINENRQEELLYTYILAKNGGRFRRVTYYPGAVVGRIFQEGTLVTVAEVNDGDVSCVK